MYATYAPYLRESVADAASVRHYDLGVIEPSYGGELSEILGNADPRIATGSFHLYGAEITRESNLAGAAPPAPVIPYLIADRGDGAYIVTLLLNEERLVELIKSDITQMRDDVSVNDSGEIGIGPAVAAADFVLVPGASVVHHAAVELAEPVMGAITTGMGLGKGAQLRSAARELAMNGVSPATYDRTAPTVLRSVSEHAPQLLSPEAVARTSSPDPAFNTSMDSTLAHGVADSLAVSAHSDLPRDPAAPPGTYVDVDFEDTDEDDHKERTLHLEVPHDRIVEPELTEEFDRQLEPDVPALADVPRPVIDRAHIRARDYVQTLSLE